MEEVPDNVDALTVFKTREWIGSRSEKNTRSETPSYVHFQKDSERQLIISSTYLIHFPDVNLPVTESIY